MFVVLFSVELVVGKEFVQQGTRSLKERAVCGPGWFDLVVNGDGSQCRWKLGGRGYQWGYQGCNKPHLVL